MPLRYFLIGFFLSALSALHAATTIIRGPYLQTATPTSMVVRWRTDTTEASVVSYGLERNQLTSTARAEGIGAEHIVLVADLKPNTRYFYSVGATAVPPPAADKKAPAEDAPGRAAINSFTTPPVAGPAQPTRIWVLGDPGTKNATQTAVRDAYYKYTGTRATDLWLLLGDNAYPDGTDTDYQKAIFEIYPKTLATSPVWPALGNHDQKSANSGTQSGVYYDIFTLPTRGEAGGLMTGTEAYYAFDYANIHFICLDSHDLDRRPSEPMARWLKADLEKTHADWQIAFWHHPPYTKGSHDSDKEKDLTEMRQHLMPLIEQGGVDLVLTGHSHSYERSMLMDGAYATNTVAENVILDDGDGDPSGDGAYHKSAGIHPHEGTVQVVTGNAGQSMGRVGTMPVMRKIIVEFGSVLIDVNGETLVARMINRDGVERDLFSVVKHGQVSPNRLALPWQPAAWVKPSNTPSIPAAPAIDHQILIPQGASWQYAYDSLPSGLDWTQPGFDAGEWRSGDGGFGFGKGQHRTDVQAMQGWYSVLYLRRAFEIEHADRVTELGLQIEFGDAFIAYLNGHEVARVGVGRSSGRNAQKITRRSERRSQYVVLKDAYKHLRNGTNLLAIEAHNSKAAISSFHLDPSLLLED